MPVIKSKIIRVKDAEGVWHDLPATVSEESFRAAQRALASETSASASAASAASSAGTAGTKASEASASAASAYTAADDARSSMSLAFGAASTAEAKASDAQSYAGQAQDAASVAGSYKDTAVEKAAAAALSEQNAAASASAASSSETAAAGCAASAEADASDAEAYGAGTRGGEPVESDDPAYHNNAAYYADRASSAEASATSAAASAAAAEAWATGGSSGTPSATNNAEYWAGEAEDAAESVSASAAQIAQNTGDIADVKTAIEFTNSYVMESIPTTLPSILKGNFATELGSESNVFCGTQNVAQLFGIKEGTYDCRGCTITVTGNKVKLNGTVSNGGPYWGLTSGSMVSQADAGAVTLPLPERKYTLSQYLTRGSSYPPLCIRSKSNSNIIALNNNTGVFTFSASTCGELYIALSATTYDCEFTIALFPYETTNGNAYRNTDSSVMTISADGIYQLDGYTWGSGTFSIAELRTKLPKKPKCLYSTRTIGYTGMTECLDIYIPAKNGYINYIFGHTVNNPEGNGDNWRLVQVDAVNDAFAYQFHITQLGETEMAIMLTELNPNYVPGSDDPATKYKYTDRSDFIGGYTHGDEVMIDGTFKVYLDGQDVDVDSLTALTEFDRLRIFLVSNMYDPADHETLVGTHGREWEFDATGLYLSQTVIFAYTGLLGNSYMPMVCAIRGNDTASALQITDTYIDNGNFTPYDVSVGGFSGYPKQFKSDVDEMYLFGETSGVEVCLDLIDQPRGLNGEGVFISNTPNAYNKMYNAICGYDPTGAHSVAQSVSAGDKWQIKAKIEIKRG